MQNQSFSRNNDPIICYLGSPLKTTCTENTCMKPTHTIRFTIVRFMHTYAVEGLYHNPDLHSRSKARVKTPEAINNNQAHQLQNTRMDKKIAKKKEKAFYIQNQQV